MLKEFYVSRGVAHEVLFISRTEEEFNEAAKSLGYKCICKIFKNSFVAIPENSKGLLAHTIKNMPPMLISTTALVTVTTND